MRAINHCASNCVGKHGDSARLHDSDSGKQLTTSVRCRMFSKDQFSLHEPARTKASFLQAEPRMITVEEGPLTNGPASYGNTSQPSHHLLSSLSSSLCLFRLGPVLSSWFMLAFSVGLSLQHFSGNARASSFLPQTCPQHLSSPWPLLLLQRRKIGPFSQGLHMHAFLLFKNPINQWSIK
jgi:hypothetical protein